MQRVLAREVHVSDIIQHLSDLDPEPWATLVGWVPTYVGRERPLARLRTDSGTAGDIDLVLISESGEELLIEVKVGHIFSDDQQNRYEMSCDGRLMLAGLASDEFLIESAPRWEYLRLVDCFAAWCDSPNEEASILARSVYRVIAEWDGVLAGMFEKDNTRMTLDSVGEKFLAIVIGRQMANMLKQRGWDSYAGTSSGSSGTALVQAWAPIQGDDERNLIAEIRWNDNTRTGVLRIGVDYSALEDSIESRTEVWSLAKAMDDDIRIDALVGHLRVDHPHLAPLVTRSGPGRQAPAKDDVWLPVIKHGLYQRVSNPGGLPGGRKSNNPGFAGDHTRRFQAVSPIDFSKASALDLLELLEASLQYLQNRLPRHSH